MEELELEALEKEYITIDINKLSKSKIKQIILPLSHFIEWKGLDLDGKTLSKSKLFNACLSAKYARKAKLLNKLYAETIWNLLDDEFKEKMTIKDFVD